MMSETKTSLSPQMRNKLNEVTAQLQQFRLLRGGLQYVLLIALILLGVGALDYFLPLPLLLRVGLIAGFAATALGLFVVWLKHRDQIDDQTAAREIESANPTLGQRLRTSQQFDTPRLATESPKLSSALIEQTNTLTSNMEFSNPIRWRTLGKWLLGIGTVACAVLSLVVIYPEARITLARMLMMPVHYSELSLEELEPVVAGTNAKFTANASGRALKKVELWVRSPDTTEWTKVPMLPPGYESEEQPDEVRGELTATIKECEDDLIYKLVASPLPTSTGRLKVLQPLEQQSFQATIEPPTYLGIPTDTTSDMEFTVVEGSMVSLALNLNRQPATAELVSAVDNGKVPLEIRGTELVCDLAQLEETKSYSIRAKSEDGMKFSSDRIRVRVKKDKGPKVVIQKPKDELSVFATTEVGLSVRASDDFGVGKVGIEYQINDGEKKTLWETDLHGEKKELAAVPVMYLENDKLTHEDAVTYYAFAEDNRPDPKRTRSPLHFLDIQPYKREFQIVDSNCKGGGSCNSLTLEELIKRQRHNLSRTFANLDRQPIQDSLSKRLATSQREIQQATDEFTVGWEQEFGPMPSLHAASKSMNEAAEQLDAKALDPAMPLEETALANLIKAKQNVRKFLKNCKGGGGKFSQCKNFDTSMAQRLRQPKHKDDVDAEQSLAETRQQIQELAEQQKRFSEDVAAASGGAKLDKKPNQNQSQSQSKSGSPKPGQSQSGQKSLAQSQQSAAQKAQQMQQAMQSNQAASELAQQKMDDAQEKIEQSAQDLEKGDQLAAAEKAKQAADLLEQLDEHLKGLNGGDLAKRLAIAEQIASRLANGESAMAQSLSSASGSGSGSQSASSSGSPAQTKELAETQDRLADQAETLADLLRHLEADALGDDVELRQGLGELQDDTTPDDLATEMHQISQSIKNQESQAAKSANSAATQLHQIANGLGELRRGALQPQLDKLLAAESQAAELLSAISAASTQSELNQMYEGLQEKLDELDVRPPAQASSAIQPAVGQQKSSTTGTGGGGGTGPEFFYAGQARNAELREILNVLQSQIQDAILLTARMDADEPIPAKYRELVNEYYQKLSDDLR